MDTCPDLRTEGRCPPRLRGRTGRTPFEYQLQHWIALEPRNGADVYRVTLGDRVHLPCVEKASYLSLTPHFGIFHCRNCSSRTHRMTQHKGKVSVSRNWK